MFNGFRKFKKDLGDVCINFVIGGSGPGLLLLHGHPQTHCIWHKVAEELAQNFTVVATDLRGYGDSSKPIGLPDHSNYSKRTMALDQLRVMQQLGFEKFFVLAHDRGARVAHRMAADYPDNILKLVILDVAPTLAMYEKTTKEFAASYYHWFFLIRPTPFPETLIGTSPEMYLKHTIGGRSAGLAPFTEQAYAEYLRCINDPATIHGICEDYRASATIDLVHDQDDINHGKKLSCEILALWGKHGVVGKCFDVMSEWNLVANQVEGKSLDCGHYIPEEVPSLLLAEVIPFLHRKINH